MFKVLELSMQWNQELRLALPEPLTDPLNAWVFSPILVGMFN